MRKQSFWAPGSMVARLKLKGIDKRAPPGVEPVASAKVIQKAQKQCKQVDIFTYISKNQALVC